MTINCTHCGRDGHSSNICPRDDYSSDLPSLTCSQCVRTVVTARGGDNTNQIYVGIQPCSLHSTLTSQPPSAAPTALSTALAPTAPAPAPPAAAPAPAAAPVPHAAAPVQNLNPTGSRDLCCALLYVGSSYQIVDSKEPEILNINKSGSVVR